MTRPNVALIRGKYLNRFEMQSYELLTAYFNLTGFGSLTSIHQKLSFPTIALPSPMDLVDPLQSIGIPARVTLGLVNRIVADGQYLIGLESRLRGFAIAHSAESYFHYTAQALAAKRKGYVDNVVITSWETIPHNHEGIPGRRRYKQNAFAHADQFIATTQLARRALIADDCDPAKIAVIYPGIDTKRFAGKKTIAKQARKLLFVGRLEEEKGIWDVMNVFKRLTTEEPNLTLTVCGQGSQKTQLLRFVADNGLGSKVIIKESTYADMPRVYNDADIVIVPSKETKYWNEQFGMVLIEAMASGIPIVAYATGAIPEVVGNAGHVVKPLQKSLYEALQQLIDDYKLRDRYSQIGLKRVSAVFDRVHTAQALRTTYQKLLIQ